MAHWVHQYEDRLREATNGTGWTMTVSDNESGPVTFEHADGSEASFTDSRSRTGTVRVEYHPSEDAKAGVKFHNHGESAGTLENGVEIAENMLKQHAKKNE